MSLYSEKEIIKGCQENDRVFQELLYQEYYSKLLKICIRYAKNFEDAEQLLNDSFLSIFGHIKSFKQSGSLEGWIKRITVNTCLDYLRSKQLKDQLKINYTEQLEQENFTDLNASALEQLDFKELIMLIHSLPPMSKTVFNLYVFDGFIHKEIAAMLDITEGTSSWHLHHARTLLQQKIKNNNIEKPLYERKRV